MTTYLIAKQIEEGVMYRLVNNPKARNYEYNFGPMRSKPDAIIELPSKLEKWTEGHHLLVQIPLNKALEMKKKK